MRLVCHQPVVCSYKRWQSFHLLLVLLVPSPAFGFRVAAKRQQPRERPRGTGCAGTGFAYDRAASGPMEQINVKGMCRVPGDEDINQGWTGKEQVIFYWTLTSGREQTANSNAQRCGMTDTVSKQGNGTFTVSTCTALPYHDGTSNLHAAVS